MAGDFRTGDLWPRIYQDSGDFRPKERSGQGEIRTEEISGQEEIRTRRDQDRTISGQLNKIVNITRERKKK